MEDQDQIILRIEQILDDYKLTQSEFAAKIGISKAKLSHYLTQHSKPSLELIKNTLEQFGELNSDWLILGIGPMRSLNNNEDIIDSNNDNSTNKDSLIDIENNLFTDTVIDNELIAQDAVKQESVDSSINNYTAKTRDSIKNDTEIVNNKSDLEDNTKSLEIDISDNTSTQAKISDSKVKKIILLYNNNTYQEFLPNN